MTIIHHSTVKFVSRVGQRACGYLRERKGSRREVYYAKCCAHQKSLETLPLELSGIWNHLVFGVIQSCLKVQNVFPFSPLKYYKLFQIFFFKKIYHCPCVLRLKSQQDSAYICFSLCDCACSLSENSLEYMQAWNIVRFSHLSF